MEAEAAELALDAGGDVALHGGLVAVIVYVGLDAQSEMGTPLELLRDENVDRLA